MDEEEAGGEVGRSDWWVAVRGVVGDDLRAEHVSTGKGAFVGTRERGVGCEDVGGWVGKDVIEAVYEEHV